MEQLTDDQRLQLESIVDSASLSAVMASLARLCEEKQKNAAEKWADAISAREWSFAARRVWTIHDTLAKKTHL